MEFNKRISAKILKFLESARDGELSVSNLEANLSGELEAMDSMFPTKLRDMIDCLVHEVLLKQRDNGAEALNTAKQFTYDENEGVPELYDRVIEELKRYLNE